MVFKITDEELIAFREKVFKFGVLLSYPPIMRGIISVNKERNEITVKGLMNWTPIVCFFCVILLASIDTGGESSLHS